MENPMLKPRIGLFVLIGLSALAVAAENAMALKATESGTSDGACTEMFHECLRGCGPPGSNLACEKYCEEQVLAKCKAGGAARGSAVKPGTAKPGIKAAPQ
jgi:hypothetical protein